MIELIEIENKISKLSNNDLKIFRDWFYDYDNQIWDKNLESDTESGKLDELATFAMHQYQQGKFTAL